MVTLRSGRVRAVLATWRSKGSRTDVFVMFININLLYNELVLPIIVRCSLHPIYYPAWRENHVALAFQFFQQRLREAILAM